MHEAPWLVVATSARALAQSAARHGHAVCAIDAYADRDTLQACGGRALSVALDDAGTFGADHLEAAVDACLRRHAPRGFRGIVAGSGLDASWALRAQLARRAPLAGCEPASLQSLRDPVAWCALLRHIGAPHPQTCFSPPAQARGWLVKRAGGTGGLHVQPWRRGAPLPEDAYFQRRGAGRPASLLFAAQEGRIHALGWQWQQLSPIDGLPWRYGGVLTAPDMPAAARTLVLGHLRRIAAAVRLRGVGSLDFLLDGQDVQLLEINPRPTASIALYPHLDLFGMHVGTHRPIAHATTAAPAEPARGECILYATAALTAHPRFDWPPWCADIPATAVRFAAGDAVCTVQAQAASVRGMRLRLAHRLQQMARTLRAAQNQEDISDLDHEPCHEHESERQCLGAATGPVAAGGRGRPADRRCA